MLEEKIDISHKKLTIHKINFNKINEYTNIIQGDILFSTLGTTKKEGGKKEVFSRLYLSVRICENGKKWCAFQYSLVSSIAWIKILFLLSENKR